MRPTRQSSRILKNQYALYNQQQIQHQQQLQLLYKAATSFYQPTPQQQEEEQSSVIPKPITVPTLREQDQTFVTNSYAAVTQSSYAALGGKGKQGASIKKRVEMGLLSGIEEEVLFSLKALVKYSYQDPLVFSIKENPFVLESLVRYLDCSKIKSEYTSTDLRSISLNDNLNFTLDAALALRNFSQVIENSAVMSLSSVLKEILIKILNNKVVQNFTIGDDEYEASVELLRYSLDIVESISSYLSPAPKDDPLFNSLLDILSTSEDRYTIISILRSLSRLLVRTTSDSPSSAEDIPDSILDQVSSYLLASSPMIIPDHGNDELLLASIDFLYQFCLAGDERISTLLKSQHRCTILRSVLPKLLVHGLEQISTEFLDKMDSKRILKLVKRVKNSSLVSPPALHKELFDQIKLLEEPERATTWMRCCYEPVQTGEVTQISLWKAYEAEFSARSDETKKLLPAVDFIKNVSNSFPHSSAKVLNQSDGTKKFVIKGIQPRQFPVSVELANSEAVQPPEADEEDLEMSEDIIHEDLDQSEQAPFKLFNYGANDKISVNEINTSSALLINSLVKTELGHQLFQGSKDELLTKVLMVPNLFSHIYESLEYIDY